MKLMVGQNCSPCTMLKTWLQEQNIEVEQIMAEENMSLAQELGIRSVPTLILDDNSLIMGIELIKEHFKKESE